MKRLNILILLLFFLIFESGIGISQDVSSYVQTVGSGKIDWSDGIIKVKGNGVPPKEMSGAQAKLMAKRAAIADAYRNLAEIVFGVQIDSETTVKNFVTENDVINTKVSGFIKGAQVYEEKQLPDGSYEVELIARLLGDGSLGMIIFEEIAKKQERKEITPQVEQPSEEQEEQAEIFTGLVIDARGTGVKPCLSPRVDDITPQLVYDASYVDKEILLKEGVVTYLKAENEEEQGKINEIMLAMANGTYSDIPLFNTQDNSYYVASWLSKFGQKVEKFIRKVGSNPLLVQALTGENIDLSTVKNPTLYTLYNLLISQEDREKIENAVKVNDFLREGKVVVVLGDKEVRIGKADYIKGVRK
jgi:hypothetical protein